MTWVLLLSCSASSVGMLRRDPSPKSEVRRGPRFLNAYAERGQMVRQPGPLVPLLSLRRRARRGHDGRFVANRRRGAAHSTFDATRGSPPLGWATYTHPLL